MTSATLSSSQLATLTRALETLQSQVQQLNDSLIFVTKTFQSLQQAQSHSINDSDDSDHLNASSRPPLLDDSEDTNDPIHNPPPTLKTLESEAKHHTDNPTRLTQRPYYSLTELRKSWRDRDVPLVNTAAPAPSTSSSINIGTRSPLGRSGRSGSNETPSAQISPRKLESLDEDNNANPMLASRSLPSSPHHASFASIPSSLSSSISASSIYVTNRNKIKLNVGGTIFCTTLSTLSRDAATGSMLAAMFNGNFPLESDSSGCYFLDRDPALFRHVLNYLRDGSLILSSLSSPIKAALTREAKYFGLSGLVSQLQADHRATKASLRRELSQEKEYKLVTNIDTSELSSVFTRMTSDEGYDFESWIHASSAAHPANTRNSSISSISFSSSPRETKNSPSGAAGSCIHILFSKQLSRAELMLLDRLQTDT